MSEREVGFCGEEYGSGLPWEARKQNEDWSKRYMLNLERYRAAANIPEMALAVADGLELWSKGMPYCGWRTDGRRLPANAYSLGPERGVLRRLRSRLVTCGNIDLADRIASEIGDMMVTAEALDQVCADLPPDLQAEMRLVGTAQLQAQMLAATLREIDFEVPVSSSRLVAKARRSKARAAQVKSNPAADGKLMEAWESATTNSMSRKEFCAHKGISMRDFTRAQDRHRKRRGTSAEKQM